MKTLIIIPAYNEEKSIGGVIDDINQHIDGVDILVVNDGSTDSTGDVAASRGVTVVNLPYNLGIGAAMQTGYIYADRKGYDIAVQFDGDGQHRADEIEFLRRPVIEGAADAVVGSRFLGRKGYGLKWYRRAAIKVISGFISLFAGQKITDSTSGFRAANRRVIEFYSSYYPDDYPEPEAIVLLGKAGFKIVEVPAGMRERLEGTSSITVLKGFYYVAKVLLAIMIDLMKKPYGGRP